MLYSSTLVILRKAFFDTGNNATHRATAPPLSTTGTETLCHHYALCMAEPSTLELLTKSCWTPFCFIPKVTGSLIPYFLSSDIPDTIHLLAVGWCRKILGYKTTAANRLLGIAISGDIPAMPFPASTSPRTYVAVAVSDQWGTQNWRSICISSSHDGHELH